MSRHKREKKQYEYSCPITPTASYTRLKDGKKRICKPEHKLKITPHSRGDIAQELVRRSSRVSQELIKGLDAVHSYPKSVTFFGSARFEQSHLYYKKAQYLASHICRMGFAVITGGGSGIMEAGNRGTAENCGSAVGFNIELPHEQVINPYVTHGVNFHYFFTRKVALTFSAEVYVFFPGGFGTLDEFFEIVTLVQTKKIKKVPIILIGQDYWKPLNAFIKETLSEKFETISKTDLDLYTITDDLNKALEIIEKAETRNQ